VAGEVHDLGVEVEEGALPITGADGQAGFEFEGIAVTSTAESFADVANFLVEAQGGGLFGFLLA
jgi:hypothetical protein